MGTPFGESGQGESFGNNGSEGQGQPGINPAWNEALSQLPPEFHSKVIPTFQKWDQNHQQGVQKVHSQYEPYKEFVDNGVQPEQIRIAMGIAQLLEENPQAVYEALQADFGQQQGPKGNGNGQQDPSDQGFGEQGNLGSEFEGLPQEFVQRFQQLEEQNNMMREFLTTQHETDQQKQEDAELDRIYEGITQKSETFRELNKNGAAEPYMNSLFMAGYGPDQAVEMFENFVDAVRSYNNRPKAPTILGAGGFMPERQVRPRDLSDQQTKQLMTDMIKSALHQD